MDPGDFKTFLGFGVTDIIILLWLSQNFYFFVPHFSLPFLTIFSERKGTFQLEVKSGEFYMMEGGS